MWMLLTFSPPISVCVSFSLCVSMYTHMYIFSLAHIHYQELCTNSVFILIVAAFWTCTSLSCLWQHWLKWLHLIYSTHHDLHNRFHDLFMQLKNWRSENSDNLPVFFSYMLNQEPNWNFTNVFWGSDLLRSSILSSTCQYLTGAFC